MRNTIILAAALAASYVSAENLFGAVAEVEKDQIRNLQGRLNKRGRRRNKLTCKERVNGPEDIDEPCFFMTDFFLTQTAAVKSEQIWTKITEDTDAESEPIGIWWDKFDNFFTQKANGSFCNRSDQTRVKRPKIVHNQGLVARASWKPVADNGYTGMMATGSDNIIMRISEAQNLTELSTGLTPAAALKFFVDGIESQNILVQNSFMQSESWNFFEKPLANRV